MLLAIEVRKIALNLELWTLDVSENLSPISRHSVITTSIYVTLGHGRDGYRGSIVCSSGWKGNDPLYPIYYNPKSRRVGETLQCLPDRLFEIFRTDG